MKYKHLKAAADAERKKQKLVKQILTQESNKISKTALLAMSLDALIALIPVPVQKKSKK